MSWRKAKIARKMSELEESETAYRVKLDRIKLCKTGLDVAAGHLKGLPTIILTNLVILIVASVQTNNLSIDGTYLRTVATWTLVAFAASFLFMSWLSFWLTPRLTKNERHAEDLLDEVKALRRLTVIGFRTYWGTMPTIAPRQVVPGQLDNEGKLNRVACNLEWRKNPGISTSIRNDMYFFSQPLVERMNDLSALSSTFADLFDAYSMTFQQEFRKLDNKLKGEEVETSIRAKIAVVGTYLYFSKEIQNELDLGPPQPLVIDPQVLVFLRDFLGGDSTSPVSIASLRINGNLAEKAKSAKDAQTKALSEHAVVFTILTEKLAKWESL